jgi:beta-phosphoglucomutase-like phosphatase (HAD superfamily)
MHIRAVILDMDGLMLDTEAIAREVWSCAAADCGFEMSEEVFLSLVGRTRMDSDSILQEHFGVDFSMDEFGRACRERWNLAVAQRGIPVKRGLPELLDFLETAGIPSGVATSTARADAERSLEIAGLAGRVPCLATGDEVLNGKPAPDIFLLAAERLGVLPESCLVLEDSRNGIRGAHASGAVPVMVPDLIEPGPEIERLAFRIFPSLVEVREWLERERS